VVDKVRELTQLALHLFTLRKKIRKGDGKDIIAETAGGRKGLTKKKKVRWSTIRGPEALRKIYMEVHD